MFVFNHTGKYLHLTPSLIQTLVLIYCCKFRETPGFLEILKSINLDHEIIITNWDPRPLDITTPNKLFLSSHQLKSMNKKYFLISDHLSLLSFYLRFFC